MRELLTVILAVGAAFLVLPCWAGGYKAPASEVMALPKFCWNQYSDQPLGPDFQIPRSSCGDGMNHYCPALLMVNRSSKAKTKSARTQLLQVGLKETEYTLNWMKNYPECPIREHVEQTLYRVRTALGLPTALVPGALPPDGRPPFAPAPYASSPQATAPGPSSPSAVSTNNIGESQGGEAPTSAGPPGPPPARPATPKRPNCRFCPD
jgi:hypothetical protein